MNLPNNVAIINITEYKELVLGLKLLEREIAEHERKVSEIHERYVAMERYILNNIYKDKEYSIKNLKLDGDTLDRDYYYNSMVQEFVDLGIKDFNYIDKCIMEFYERHLKETKEEQE